MTAQLDKHINLKICQWGGAAFKAFWSTQSVYNLSNKPYIISNYDGVELIRAFSVTMKDNLAYSKFKT